MQLPLDKSNLPNILTPHQAMENGGISQAEGKDPSSFLSDIIGNSVVVKLNSGVVYKGTFSSGEETKSPPPPKVRWGDSNSEAVLLV